MASDVKFTSSLTGEWLKATTNELDIAVAEMITDIDRRAKTLAPVDRGNLAASGKIERIKAGSYKVTFGSNSVPYARRRHFENKKNPQTLGYLEKAGDSVSRGDITKYLRNK